MIGHTINAYEIVEEAGRGGAATVYVARQQPVGRYVALKVFDHLTSDSVTRLQQLFDRIEQFDHTNILPVYANGQTDDRVYWVMRYMPAGTLQARLRAQRLTLEEIDRCLSQVSSALDYAHQRGVVHGDLKPSNILLDHPGNAFVSDFGLFEVLGQTPSDYQPPRFVQRPGSIPDARSDVYALGALLYELLTSRPPVDPHARPAKTGGSGEDERVNRRIVLPPKPSTINSRLPAAIDSVVLKALAIDPDQRYPTPAELAAAYIKARTAPAAVEPITHRPEPSAAQPIAGSAPAVMEPTAPVRRISPRRSILPGMWRWVAGGIVGLLIVIGAIGLLSSQPPAAISPPSGAPIPAPSATAAPISTPPPAPTVTPSPQPTRASVPAVAATAALSPTLSPTPTLKPTLSVRSATRPFFTPTPSVTIDPLALLMPRLETRTSLNLLFHTHVRPDDAGTIGTLSLSIPPIESRVINRGLAQVGSGEQSLQVSVSINCGSAPQRITTEQIVLTIRDDQGNTLFSQTLDYIKRWCE